MKFQRFLILRESGFFIYHTIGSIIPFADCSLVLLLAVKGKIIWGKWNLEERLQILLFSKHNMQSCWIFHDIH
jgi:hypothetical protein